MSNDCPEAKRPARLKAVSPLRSVTALQNHAALIKPTYRSHHNKIDSHKAHPYFHGDPTSDYGNQSPARLRSEVQTRCRAGQWTSAVRGEVPRLRIGRHAARQRDSPTTPHARTSCTRARTPFHRRLNACSGTLSAASTDATSGVEHQSSTRLRACRTTRLYSDSICRRE